MMRFVLLLLFVGISTFSWAGNARTVPAPITAREVPTDAMTTSFDLIVYGAEPEAILAAVTAAEEGLVTALIAQDTALGGLYTQGWLNVLDLKTQPHDYQLGIFDRWWRRVGRTEAFDIHVAEQAFQDMLNEAGVHVLLGVVSPTPVRNNETITGLFLPGEHALYRTKFVIDASADADFAAAAGAPFTLGWESYGVNLRMADTLVFRLSGVDWARLTNHIRREGSQYAVAKDTVAWGHFGGEPARYTPSSDRFKLRGLNLGLQHDGSVLVNALLIYGIDPLSEASVQAGREAAVSEAKRVTAYLAERIPGLEHATMSGAAPELYVRESRHLQGLCTLDAWDVMYNVTGPHAIAAGGYPLDAQSFTPHDTGYVWATPGMFGGRLCMATPPNLSNVFVAGRSGSYDPVTFSSGRIVPYGVAMAEGIAVAAARAVRHDISAERVATSDEHIRAVRSRLTERGAYLPPVDSGLAPLGPHTDPHYEAFVLLVSRGLALGGYDNNPKLHEGVSSISFGYLLSNVATRFFYNAQAGEHLVHVLRSELGIADTAPLSEHTARELTERAACAVAHCASVAWPAVQHPEALTRGESYAFAAALAELALTPPAAGAQ